MSNLGKIPLDPHSEVTHFRSLVGDLIAAETPNPDIGEYQIFSDADIIGYLAANPDNVYRAVADGYRALASRAALETKVVKDYDLQVDLTKRSAAMLAVADQFDIRADNHDNANGGSFFENVGNQPVGWWENARLF